MFGANSAPILHPNRPKWDFAWPTLRRSSIRCVQNDLWAYGLAQTCTYLASGLALSPNRPKQASSWASEPRSTIGCVQNDFWAYGMFSTNRAPISHWHRDYVQIDRNEIPYIGPTSPRMSSIRCVQSDFRAYGTFTANHAPILCQHKQYL
jgi:hypothetical protein